LSDWRTRPEIVRIKRLLGVEVEHSDVRTLSFEDEICSKAVPGQYVMIWAPGLEEVPMSLSHIDQDGASSVTVQPVGETTDVLCRLEKGDSVGIRGPFGKGFTVVGKAPLIVAGGIGSASLKPLADDMVKRGVESYFVLGSRSIDQLIFREFLEGLLSDRLIITTDDGSYGNKGLASERALELLDDRKFDIIYMCGPELMMAAIFDAAEERGIPVQASLERYIKCAVGICGSCAIGPFTVCRDGPVFHSEQLRSVSGEFGRWRMDPSGRIVEVDH
jgi:dihydroorotate dehydrogenase electron transfer subunit